MATKKPMNPMVVLLLYSVMMVTLPVIAFFASQYVVEQAFGVSSSGSYVYATGISVILIHVILGLFVYQAYKEDAVVSYPEKED